MSSLPQIPQITSAALIGIEAVPITVETDIAFGMPQFHIVGLPDAAVRESRERIRAAIRNSGFSFPRTHITVNLAPADIKKQGPMYDLPVALAILLSEGEFDRAAIADLVVMGELSLDGMIRRVAGALAASLMAKRCGFTTVFVPQDNVQEAACIKGLRVLSAPTLKHVVEHLKGIQTIIPSRASKLKPVREPYAVDFKDIKGQSHAKRGLEIAAAGAHNLLLQGPPGTGKTMLARALPSILPLLTHEEALETTAIASVAGVLHKDEGILSIRPFRHPHHSCSAISLVGGGAWPRPGEVSLAHRGILFLDELPEFSRHVLEHLRQPLEDGEVTISRAAASIRFPARFLLVAAMNPCPCGYLTDPKKSCVCTAQAIGAYCKKISGPLLDRFDMVIEVPNVEPDALLNREQAEPSADIRKRVQVAREAQARRFTKTSFITNAEIPQAKLLEWCACDNEARGLLEQALRTQHVSARGFARAQKVARTIADLEGASLITSSHIAEALQYRPQSKN